MSKQIQSNKRLATHLGILGWATFEGVKLPAQEITTALRCSRMFFPTHSTAVCLHAGFDLTCMVNVPKDASVSAPIRPDVAVSRSSPSSNYMTVHISCGARSEAKNTRATSWKLACAHIGKNQGMIYEFTFPKHEIVKAQVERRWGQLVS